MYLQGLGQIRYLYAGHMYGWGADQVGSADANCLFFSDIFIFSTAELLYIPPEWNSGSSSSADSTLYVLFGEA
jgi:hypothetical protein